MYSYWAYAMFPQLLSATCMWKNGEYVNIFNSTSGEQFIQISLHLEGAGWQMDIRLKMWLSSLGVSVRLPASKKMVDTTKMFRKAIGRIRESPSKADRTGKKLRVYGACILEWEAFIEHSNLMYRLCIIKLYFSEFFQKSTKLISRS